MNSDEVLSRKAELHGVQQQFWDIFGHPHITTPETNQAILTALGPEPAAEELWRKPLPPTHVVLQNKPNPIPIRCLADAAHAEMTLRFEDETKRVISFNLQDIPITSELAPFVERAAELPADLPLGYHTLHLWNTTCRLIVAPESAIVPSHRCAGLGITLWGLRSERNWGVGDFRDLTQLLDWAHPALHAQFLALNPLHAIQNRKPYNSSPYLPNSTYYRNFLYLDVEAVPGYDQVRGQIETPGHCAERDALRNSETVEYERAAALKLTALAKIYAAAPPTDEAQNWIANEGELLRLFAVYSALDEHLHAKDPDLWIWPDWPEEFHDPNSRAVAEFAAQNPDRIQFHGWLQWLVDRQIEQVQAHAKAIGMSIGLYHDLALATDRCGSDLWAHRPFYISGCRVGSPPDDFSPTGQDWSFPPPNSEKHREDGYRLYIDSIRKTLRHGGALRIDHVMRLFRLYWIPEAHDATQGAYVRDRAEDLVRILMLESVRANAIVIGEDLGTVEPAVREALAHAGILSYRLLYFEREHNRFKSPAEYPESSLTASTTHDLPTITGFWTGADIDARRSAGRLDEAGYQAQWEDRIREKQRLLDALAAADLLPVDHSREAAKIPVLTPELHYAIVGFLATTKSMLWLINQEDMTKEPDQQNLPGTTSEYPNWSRKMRWSIEELGTLKEAVDCAAMVRHWVEKTGRA